MTVRRSHELVPFLALWAVRYQEDYKLNGLHPVHYDLMQKYGARMDSFQRATNAVAVGETAPRNLTREEEGLVMDALRASSKPVADT